MHQPIEMSYSSLKDIESKVMSLGCILMSAGISSCMITWTFHLLVEKGIAF
ncbi:MAG TPA: hypothetical protein VGU61_00385 [Noviherbaspirillum sp.]|uniref:hypothetical protein n=1 Tax=Noviherbaspirillum sp. TaxID=1926288 RepID=UPI002DDD946F|nr:hypothetical protein [Noviherbaspirillum sp.]HEV2608694.1 hypothetical protein [Noviherbaspirillum sp.]